MIKDTSNIVCGLGENNLETLGSAQIDVTSVGPFTVLMVKDLGYSFILGADELKRGDAKFDFSTEILTWFGMLYHMQSCPNSVHHGEISTSISTGNCQVDKILTEFSDVFDSPSKPLSPCNLIECDIPTGDARPIRQLHIARR